MKEIEVVDNAGDLGAPLSGTGSHEPSPDGLGPSGFDPSRLRDVIQSALESELSGAYDCTRVWCAWGYGTMGEDDFTPITERLDEIVSTVCAALLPDVDWDGPLTTEEQAMIDAAWLKHRDAQPCIRPPQGWFCTRAPGHDGPCAAHPMPDKPWQRDSDGSPKGGDGEAGSVHDGTGPQGHRP